MPEHSPLATRIYQVLKTWLRHGRPMGTLEGVAAVEKRIAAGHRPEVATHTVLTESIATLATRLPRHARFLDLHFVKGRSIRYLAAHDLLEWAESTLYVKQWEAIEAIASLLQSQDPGATVRHTPSVAP